MSIRVMTLVSERFPRGGSDLICMLMLSDWCSDEGDSLYPSISFLAAKMRVSESQARRVLHRLIAEGYIAVVGNAFGGAPGATRDYRMNVARLLDLPIAPKIAEHLARTELRHRKRPHVDYESRKSDNETAGAHARGCADATPSIDAQDGSHGCAGGLAQVRETGCMDDTLTTMNHQLTAIEPSTIGTQQKDDSTAAEARTSSKPKKAKVQAFDGLAYLLAHGVEPQVAADWLAVRKSKRSPPTETAFRAVARDGAKAGITFAEAVEYCAGKSWVGFYSDSYLRDKQGSSTAPQRINFMTSQERNRAVSEANMRAFLEEDGVTPLDSLPPPAEPFTIDME